MGRVFLLQFDQTPENEFYVCRKCQTHIALKRERTSLHEDDTELNGGLFRTAINWHSLGAESNRRVGNYVAAKIYCNNCGNPLGFHFIEVPNDAVYVRVKAKQILLRGSKLLLWDGNEIVPVPAPESEDEVEEDEVDEDEVDEDDDEVDEDEVDEDDDEDDDEVDEDEVDEDDDEVDGNDDN